MLVDGMSKLMTEKVKECESLDFHAFGLKWKLAIRSDLSENYISFFLHINDEQCTGSNWGVNCSFKLSVVSQTRAPDLCISIEFDFDSENDSRGRHIISQKVLKEKYLVNDKAVFCAEIIQVRTPKFLKVNSISRTVGTAERLKLMEVPQNNSKFTWKITQFSSFDGEHHSSYEFTVGPRRWYLKMYPKGDLEGKGKSLSLFLYASDFVSKVPVEATLAVYKLRVLDQFKRNHHEADIVHRFSSDGGWGQSKFLALEELYKASNGFLVNDAIYIGVEFLFLSPHDYL
ncbi:hypothetical protein N665_2070s0010 [Sinapis alba]|nr:hypothetical protein N665_2070s0010 [Sinapis alba]